MPTPFLWRFVLKTSEHDDLIRDAIGWEDRIEQCWLVSCDSAGQRQTRLTEVRYETTDDR